MQEAREFDEIIDSYMKQQAIDDGNIIELGKSGNLPVYATTNYYFIAGLKNAFKRMKAMREAMNALGTENVEDGFCHKTRVLPRGPEEDYEYLWVVQDAEGITLMMPEDY